MLHPQSALDALPPARRLLRDLRHVLANVTDPKLRLDRVVQTIAQGVAAQVCSIYIRRPGEVLELYATHGLAAEAVHRTRLRIGEGLIGLVCQTAAPVAAANAWQHPNFVYRPETAEEKFQSFCGVPIFLGGRVTGVLAIQNTAIRDYSGEDIESLETVAILLGYVITAGELGKNTEQSADEGTASVTTKLSGLRIHGGLAIGRALVYDAAPRVTRMLSDDPNAERQRLEAALRTMQGDISGKIHDLREQFGTTPMGQAEHVAILETHHLFARDQSWLGRMLESIASGLSAEAAVQKIHNETRARLNLVQDPYLRARMADIEDLTTRLLQHLLGEQGFLQQHMMDQDFIVVARDLGPAALLDFDRRHLRGLVLEEGAQTAHVAVVARALQIPVLGKIAEALRRIESRDLLAMDADQGYLYLRPGEDMVQTFRAQISDHTARRARYAALRDLPNVTACGTAVELCINAGLPIEVDQMTALNADGIGLFRTEIAFLSYGDVPNVAEQTEFYRQIIDAAQGKKLVFRTIDIGGDKALQNFPQIREENPAMGWRGLRLALDFPSLLRQQMRALLRAAAGRDLEMMVPMASSVDELSQARQLLQQEMDLLQNQGGVLPKRVTLGTMIEVPALLWQLPAVLQAADFISVGSNDLLQFFFAADRGGVKTAGRYDALSPSFLRMLQQLVAASAAAGKSLTVCGEMAAKPLDAIVLMALGVRQLSVTASALGPLRATLRQVRLEPFQDLLESRLETGKETSLRPLLSAFARDQGIIWPE
jgi:phosphotransferase system, enzyme I, PtsP